MMGNKLVGPHDSCHIFGIFEHKFKRPPGLYPLGDAPGYYVMMCLSEVSRGHMQQLLYQTPVNTVEDLINRIEVIAAQTRT